MERIKKGGWVGFSITAVDGCRSRRLRAVRFSIEPTAELGLEDDGGVLEVTLSSYLVIGLVPGVVR